MELHARDIERILPHRYPFLLVDRITACVPGISAEGVRCVSVSDPFFQGHFPGNPVMPGVLLLEAIAQTGAVALLTDEENRGKQIYLAGVRQARFRKPVYPGDVLSLQCEVILQKGSAGVLRGKAIVKGETAAEAELSFSLQQTGQERNI